MKIAIVKRTFLKEGGGGAEKYVRNIVEGLIKRGHTITVISEKFESEQTTKLTHIKPNSPKRIYSSGTTKFQSEVKSTLNKIRNNFDILYSLSKIYPSDIYRATDQVHIEWLMLNKSKLVKFNPRHRGILNIEKNIYKKENTKAVVTNSNLVKNLILKYYNFNADDIHVLRNGIENKIFFPVSSSTDKQTLREKLFSNFYAKKTIFLFAGSNFEIKGLKEAIASFAQLPSEFINNSLLYVAGGDNSEPYIKQAEKLGIASKIIFLGEKRNMRDYYAASDMLLFPSLGEPFGNVCLESFACGTPVITTEQNGSCEIITEGVNGYVIDSAKSLMKMSEKLASFIQLSKELKESFSNKAVEASKSYSWELHVDELEKLMQKTSCKFN